MRSLIQITWACVLQSTPPWYVLSHPHSITRQPKSRPQSNVENSTKIHAHRTLILLCILLFRCCKQASFPRQLVGTLSVSKGFVVATYAAVTRFEKPRTVCCTSWHATRMDLKPGGSRQFVSSLSSFTSSTNCESGI